MKSVPNRWTEQDGEMFLRGIGVKKSQTLLDFGCGEGHYTIPASKLVGKEGKVYALDKDRNALNKLKRMMEQSNIRNINLINENSSIALKDNSVDVALCYDVLHYLKRKDRKTIYDDIYRVLKEDALFSVYPKHYKEDSPSGELANITLKELIEEIENSGFFHNHKFLKRLLHDNYFNKGYVLNFRKGG